MSNERITPFPTRRHHHHHRYQSVSWLSVRRSISLCRGKADRYSFSMLEFSFDRVLRRRSSTRHELVYVLHGPDKAARRVCPTDH